MGYLRAYEAAEAVANGEWTLPVALEYHITTNLYPPPPRELIPSLVEVAEKAVANPEGEIDTGSLVVPAATIIKMLFLEAFIN